MSASSLSTLTPGAFRSLIGAVSSALRPVAPVCDLPPPCRANRCDVVDCCGLLFNEALREIYRLRSGLDGSGTGDACTIADRACPALTITGETGPALAAPPTHRRPYAVPAVGDVQPHPREQPPVILPQTLMQMRVITNLGTLLDVLI